MAGSYNHAVDDDGRLRDPESLDGMVENGGDVWEMAEEMYGMIWWLAERVEGPDVREIVERARQNYQSGLDVAEQVLSKE